MLKQPSKRLSKQENENFREFLAETYPACQICGWRRAVEAHHVVYGCYGANKDDRKQISVCRECHLWCHANKKESIEKFESLADENWREYETSLHA